MNRLDQGSSQGIKALGQKTIMGLLVAAVIVGCASPRFRAPVEERTSSSASRSTTTTLPPGSENAGKPGYYTVRPGDNLIRIGLETQQAWRDIQRWNNLSDANALEVGQVLRVIPPAGSSPTVSATATSPSGTVTPVAVPVAPGAVVAPTGEITGKPISPPKLDVKPLDPNAKPVAASTLPAAPAATASASTAAVPSSSPEATEAREGDGGGIKWAWPGPGAVMSGFGEAGAKGMLIQGQAGDPVYAAADGRVAYSGAGLRGYGNLIIIKHSAGFLSAYAHNQKLLVKEDQAVRRGQKIAEMGSSDAAKVQLHFEVRRQGKPIDPAKVLPSR